MDVKPFRVCSNPLGTNEAADILESTSEDQISALPPVKPKGGEMYIYWNPESSKAG